MAAGDKICFDNLDEQIIYEQQLYKAFIAPFAQYINALEFVDCVYVSELLTVGEMEQVKSEHQNQGISSGAKKLLEFLQKKPTWFDAVMKGMDIPSLKLKETKVLMLKHKADFDRKWKEEHFKPISLLPPQTTPPSIPASDFRVPNSGTECGSNSNFRQWRNVSGPNLSHQDRINPSLHQSLSVPSELHQIEEPSYLEIVPGGGSSEDVSSLQEENGGYLTAVHIPVQESRLQKDAVPEVQPPATCRSNFRPPVPPRPPPFSQIGQLQGSTSSQVQQITSREQHPSLKTAISGHEAKDFDESFVKLQLGHVPGWISLKEENEVINIIRNHLNRDGSYAIWYWALAKRPTICIVFKKNFYTFVVHKSVTRNVFYINKSQKTMPTLRELIEHHIKHGIKYKKDETEIILKFTFPLSLKHSTSVR